MFFFVRLLLLLFYSEFFFLFEWSTWRKTLMSMIQLDTVSFIRIEYFRERTNEISFNTMLKDISSPLWRRFATSFVTFGMLKSDPECGKKQYARYRKYKTHFARTQRNVAILFLTKYNTNGTMHGLCWSLVVFRVFFFVSGTKHLSFSASWFTYKRMKRLNLLLKWTPMSLAKTFSESNVKFNFKH